MIAAIKFDDKIPPGKSTSQADGRHRRLGPRVDEPHLFDTRDHIDDQLRQGDDQALVVVADADEDLAGERPVQWHVQAGVERRQCSPPHQPPVGREAPDPVVAAEQEARVVLRDQHRADPLWDIVLLRYFNPVGAHESGLIGENPKGIPNNLMPFVAQVAVGKLASLSVYGNDYPTIDGTGVRDYIHVEDLAEGHCLALHYLDTHAGVLTVNLGTERPHSVLEVIAAFERASGITVPYEFVGRRSGDLAEYFANAQLAKRMLGWVARHDLDRMCQDTWRFYQRSRDSAS